MKKDIGNQKFYLFILFFFFGAVIQSASRKTGTTCGSPLELFIIQLTTHQHISDYQII